MEFLLKICMLLLIFIELSHAENNNTFLVHKLRTDFLNLEDELWNFVLTENDKNVDEGVYIVKKFHRFDQNIQQLPQDILYGMQVARKSDNFLLLFSDVRVIYDMYDKFRRYQNNFLIPVTKDYVEYIKEITTSALIDDILYDEKNNVNKTIFSIQSQIKPLLSDLNTMVVGDTCAHPHQSNQQIFYNFYNFIAVTQLKGYMLSQFALLAQRAQEQGNYTELSLLARKEYEERSKYLYELFSRQQMYSTRKLYRCGPNRYEEGETYEQLTRLIQAHIQNEVDLNPTGTCTETCATYQDTRSYGCYDSDSEYCHHVEPCRGRIYNCKFIESHLKTCDASYNSPRRYSYIEYNGGRVMGDRRSCSKRTVNSWFRWFVHCSYCLCYCDEPGLRSDRYFSLLPTTADVNKNRVVTGIRFVKKNRVIHIQIQEGQLLPYGYIKQDTLHWKPVDDFTIHTAGVMEGKHYHVMSYFKRTMNLDILEVPDSSYVITGAKFVLNDESAIQLQIQATPFDYITGQLDPTKSTNVDLGDTSRSKLHMLQPDIPTKSPTKPDSYYYLYHSIEFTHTDLDKDAAQTTVPFIDIQPVYSDVAVPLQSAGLYFKENMGYGGFVGIHVQTFDYSNVYDFSFPKHKNREDAEDMIVDILH